LYRYFVSQSSEFCRYNPLFCFSTRVFVVVVVVVVVVVDFVIDSVRKLLDIPSYAFKYGASPKLQLQPISLFLSVIFVQVSRTELHEISDKALRD
jgi:hypothetical protein